MSTENTPQRIICGTYNPTMVRAWDLLAEGLSNKEIALLLGKTPAQIYMYRNRLHQLRNKPLPPLTTP